MNGNRIPIKRRQFEKMIDTVDTIEWRSSLDDGIINIAYQGFLFLTRNGTPQACINYDAMV